MAVLLPNQMKTKNAIETMSKKDKNEHIDNEDFDFDNKEITQVEEESTEDQLKEELGKEKDKFLRLFAEFENYKRRTSKERMELFKTASQDVMLSMLPVLDDFERALLHTEEDKEADHLRKGVLLIYQKLLSTLEKNGLTKMEIEHGDSFNPDEHEAITQIAAPSEELKGKIIDVIEKGYKLGDKIIRFPKVVTGY